jgi:hypothetical protein
MSSKQLQQHDTFVDPDSNLRVMPGQLGKLVNVFQHYFRSLFPTITGACSNSATLPTPSREELSFPPPVLFA